jgi:hypothetical protein
MSGDEMTFKLFALAFSLALSTIGASAALAAPAPKLVRQSGAWNVYAYTSDGAKRCYILSTPTLSLPRHVDHGDNFVIIAPNQNGHGFYPQALMGYRLRPQSRIDLSIDGRSFSMYPKAKSAWAKSPAADARIVAAMRTGRSMILRAVSRRGTATSYTYSLSGLTAALKSARLCR